MKVLRYVLLLVPVFFPCLCYAWTGSEWIGIIEAASGAAVLTPPTAPSSDICENCSGTGKLGDGTVSVECPVCKGTGKPVRTGELKDSSLDCADCIDTGTMESPRDSRKDASVLKQDAVGTSGGTYRSRGFRRR